MNSITLSRLAVLEEMLVKALQELRAIKQDVLVPLTTDASTGVRSGFTPEEEALWFTGDNRTLTKAGQAYFYELCDAGADQETLRHRMGMSANSNRKWYEKWKKHSQEQAVAEGLYDE